MPGVIKCPLSAKVVETYKETFHLLSQITSGKTNGMLYLRGTDAIGVIMTVQDVTSGIRWIMNPELNMVAVEAHSLDANELLQIMVNDAINICGGSMIQVDITNDALVKVITNTHRLTYTKTEDEVIGKLKDTDDIIPNVAIKDISFIESCQDAIATSWGLDTLDPYAIKEIQETLGTFLLTNAGRIKKLYQYAEGRGKYVPIEPEYDLEDILVKYDEYFNDLTGYLKSVQAQPETKKVSDAEIGNRVVKTIDIDEQFRQKLYQRSPIDVFPDAVSSLNAFIDLHLFLENVYDNFLAFATASTETTDINYFALLNIYGYSVTEFLNRFINELTTLIYRLEEVADGKRKITSSKPERPYQLI